MPPDAVTLSCSAGAQDAREAAAMRKPGVGSVEWMGLPFSPFLADSLKPIRAGRR
jgi:hypothetical protein